MAASWALQAVFLEARPSWETTGEADEGEEEAGPAGSARPPAPPSGRPQAAFWLAGGESQAGLGVWADGARALCHIERGHGRAVAELVDASGGADPHRARNRSNR